MVPLTRSWKELGLEGIPETRAEVETGDAWFARLSEQDQRAILGRTAYEAYKAGVVKLKDFIGFRHSEAWGTVLRRRSLAEILGADEAIKWRRYTRAPSQAPSPADLRVQGLAKRVAGPLARRTKTANNWNGTITVGKLQPGVAGVKNWDCSITIGDVIMNNDREVGPTVNHEVLHGLSVGLEPVAYMNAKGWEEGTVEKLQRLLGPKALQAAGEQPVASQSAYNHYIGALEKLRTTLGRSESRFYLQLLRTPLAQREQLVLDMGKRLPASKQQQWQGALGAALPILRMP